MCAEEQTYAYVYMPVYAYVSATYGYAYRWICASIYLLVHMWVQCVCVRVFPSANEYMLFHSNQF